MLSTEPQFENIDYLAFSLLYGQHSTSVHDYWKNHSFDHKDSFRQRDYLLFNMLFGYVIAFLPRRKHLLILWLQSPSTVILEPNNIKSVTGTTFTPSIWHYLGMFPRQTIKYHSNPTNKGKEAEWIDEDLQDLLELTLKTDIFFITGERKGKWSCSVVSDSLQHYGL